jgi:hypothetical protein
MVTVGERDAFLRHPDRQVRTLCLTRAYMGVGCPEAMALTVDRVDLIAGAARTATTALWRCPPALLTHALDLVHGIREPHGKDRSGRQRTTTAIDADAWAPRNRTSPSEHSVG